MKKNQQKFFKSPRRTCLGLIQMFGFSSFYVPSNRYCCCCCLILARENEGVQHLEWGVGGLYDAKSSCVMVKEILFLQMLLRHIYRKVTSYKSWQRPRHKGRWHREKWGTRSLLFLYFRYAELQNHKDVYAKMP